MPKLTLLLGRKPLKVYDVNATVVRIGREADLDVVIDNVAVSRRQAEIRLEGPDWVLRDLGSGNGTFLNGQRVDDSAALRPGDEIAFGKFALLFERVPTEPVADVPAAAPRTNGLPSSGTLLLAPVELAELQRTIAQQRRAQLQWKVNGQEGVHYLARASVLVGRSSLCDLQVPGGGPKQHILLTREGTSFEVRNLSRWYRMEVNGRVQTRAVLRSGDRIAVGALQLTFLDELR
jgi:pSer/pThr/pTyr-binding forkhead associated (FHA) protein